MNKTERKEFFEKIGKINGWDFSNLKVKSEGEKWDFYLKVRRCLTKNSISA